MKLKKQLLICSLAFLLVGAATAITPSQVHSMSDRYNSQLDEAPGFLKSLVGDQRINLHVEVVVNDTAEQQTFGLNMSNAVLSGVQDGGFENPTLEVWVDEQDIETITDSRNPLKTTSQLLEQGEIRYTSHGIINSLKISFAKLFL